jgi:hypothetical protein
VFRWNHNWAIARATEGLEPFARGTAAAAPAPEAVLPDDAVPAS